MRKYLVRKNLGKKKIDPLDVSERSVFFQKNQIKSQNIVEQSDSEDSAERQEPNQNISELDKKQEIKPNKIDKKSISLAEKLFQESFSAIDEFNDEKMKIMYRQLEEEQKLSEKLNEKLHENILKISNVELELVRKKNGLEMELQQKTDQLIKSERLSAIGSLSARLTHDLRNPLSVIKMSFENMKEMYGVDDAKEKQFDRIEHSINRITHQVDGVLDYVQKTPIEKKVVELQKIIQNAISSIKIDSNITVFPPKNDIICKCDQIKMEIVIANLFFNSVQAIGKEPGRISIKIEETVNNVMITIQDSGKGISEEHIEKIFDPLFTTKQEGTGLGLSSVKNIIEQHGGTINFKNNPTTFMVTLPK